jgi:hypothetical protein
MIENGQLNDCKKRPAFPISTMNKICYGQTPDPSIRKMFLIAHALECTIDELVDPDYNPANQTCTPEEVVLLDNFRSLNNHGHDRAMESVEDLVLAGKYKKLNFDEELDA